MSHKMFKMIKRKEPYRSNKFIAVESLTPNHPSKKVNS